MLPRHFHTRARLALPRLDPVDQGDMGVVACGFVVDPHSISALVDRAERAHSMAEDEVCARVQFEFNLPRILPIPSRSGNLDNTSLGNEIGGVSTEKLLQ